MRARDEGGVGWVTITLHWLVGLMILGLLGVGGYLGNFAPRGADYPYGLLSTHKTLGALLFVFASLRFWWRLKSGFPSWVGRDVVWMKASARVSHWALLSAGVLMPLSGMLMTWGGGYSFDFLWIIEVGPFGKAEWLGGLGHFVHEVGGWALLVFVVGHVGGALYHHVVEKDGTLRRMLGGRVGAGGGE